MIVRIKRFNRKRFKANATYVNKPVPFRGYLAISFAKTEGDRLLGSRPSYLGLSNDQIAFRRRVVAGSKREKSLEGWAARNIANSSWGKNRVETLMYLALVPFSALAIQPLQFFLFLNGLNGFMEGVENLEMGLLLLHNGWRGLSFECPERL